MSLGCWEWDSATGPGCSSGLSWGWRFISAIAGITAASGPRRLHRARTGAKIAASAVSTNRLHAGPHQYGNDGSFHPKSDFRLAPADAPGPGGPGHRVAGGRDLARQPLGFAHHDSRVPDLSILSRSLLLVGTFPGMVAQQAAVEPPQSAHRGLCFYRGRAGLIAFDHGGFVGKTAVRATRLLPAGGGFASAERKIAARNRARSHRNSPLSAGSSCGRNKRRCCAGTGIGAAR